MAGLFWIMKKKSTNQSKSNFVTNGIYAGLNKINNKGIFFLKMIFMCFKNTTNFHFINI